MKYSIVDFYFLHSAVETRSHTLGEAYENMCTFMGTPVPMPCLLHAIRGLTADGFITVEPADGQWISAGTPLSVTPAGKKAVAVSAVQKLFGESKTFRKNELRFCGLDRPSIPADDLIADENSFAACVRRLIDAGDLAFPTFEASLLGDGYIKLAVHHPNDDPVGRYEAEDFDPDSAALSYSASLVATAEQITAGLRDLIDTAYMLVTEAPRPRKIALHGVDGSLLIALANAANEHGTVAFRMTVSKIRFNRQRFIGKRDGELDYAQCGDPIFIHEMASAEGFCLFDVLNSAVLYPDLLTDGDFDKLTVIHRETRKRIQT